MATIGNLYSLYDWEKQADPDGSPAMVAELLSQSKPLIDAMIYQEGNLPVGHQVTIQTGLPTTYWRMMNKGTPSSQERNAQIIEQCAQATARSQVDASIARLNGNLNKFRMRRSKPYIESMGQEIESTMFYGSASSPEEFVGLANRYSSTSAGNGENILLAGGSGSDNTSVWLLGLGEDTIYGIFPKGMSGGLKHEDLGLQDAFDSNNDRFRAYMDYFEWNTGLVVEDWRYGARIANIDISDLAGLSGSQELTDSTFLPKLMSRAYDRMPNFSNIKPVYVMNRTSASLLKVASMEKSSSSLSVEEGLTQFGTKIQQLKFLGVPVLISDAISNAEAAIS